MRQYQNIERNVHSLCPFYQYGFDLLLIFFIPSIQLFVLPKHLIQIYLYVMVLRLISQTYATRVEQLEMVLDVSLWSTGDSQVYFAYFPRSDLRQPAQQLSSFSAFVKRIDDDICFAEPTKNSLKRVLEGIDEWFLMAIVASSAKTAGSPSNRSAKAIV